MDVNKYVNSEQYASVMRLFQSLCKLINTDIRCVNSFSVSWAFDPIQL